MVFEGASIENTLRPVFLAQVYLAGMQMTPVAVPSREGSCSNASASKKPKQQVHDTKSILTLGGTSATYGNADGSTIIAACPEGIDIKLFQGVTGKFFGVLDTN
ncbi:hypothetical protein SUGI_0978620 [Cryptomeria japonica]|nr:hypothetical protein SUGI_0978620 [Cryptomeria japonica]